MDTDFLALGLYALCSLGQLGLPRPNPLSRPFPSSVQRAYRLLGGSVGLKVSLSHLHLSNQSVALAPRVHSSLADSAGTEKHKKFGACHPGEAV